MGNSEKVINKRTTKIIKWFKNYNNLLLFSLLAFTIIIRLYFFIKTFNQPLWWDEADYLSIAKFWAFGFPFDISIVRQVLWPLILTIFLSISNTELLPRIFMLALSVTSVIALYYLGKEMFDNKVGLLSAFLMSVFYLNLFFSFRLLVDLPSLAFFTLSAFFIYRYFKTKSNTALYTGSVLIGIGTLFKISTATLLFAVLIYLFTTQRFKMFLKKEIWIALLIFFLVLSPYIIWGFFQFNKFVITAAGAYNAPQPGMFFSTGFANLIGYFSLFQEYLSWLILITFILGLLSLYKLIIGFDVLLKNQNQPLNTDWFLFLILLIPIIVVSFSVGHVENRYIINAFPAVFILSSVFLFKITDTLKKKYKILSVIIILLFILCTGYIQIQKTSSLIDSKKTSYLEVKEAGIWLKTYANQTDIVVAQSIPQIVYYSEKQAIGLPNTAEEMDELIKSNKNAKFLVVSIFENHPEWAYTYGQDNNLTIANIYFSDKARTQPALIIYNLH